jgi:AraC-like DNA-binding protein
MNRAGVLLAHPDPARVLGLAADEPGLADVFAKWHSSGSAIDTEGVATLSNGHLVSMAGIPVTDWVLVSLTPQAIALQPVVAAQLTAWKAAAGVGLLAAVLAGFLAWYVTRPISKLRSRAEKMLSETGPSAEGWPREQGEVGELALAFQQVVEQRQQKQGETQALLLQLARALCEQSNATTAAISPKNLIALQITRLAVHQDLQRKWSVPDMARLAGISSARFTQWHRVVFGATPTDDLIRTRVERASWLLKTSK